MIEDTYNIYDQDSFFKKGYSSTLSKGFSFEFLLLVYCLYDFVSRIIAEDYD